MRLFLFAAALLAPAPALAAPCTAAGLTGIWSLASIRSADPGVQAFYDQAPNEVMRFGARGDFIYVAGGAPYTAASARQSLDRADAVDGVSYALPHRRRPADAAARRHRRSKASSAGSRTGRKARRGPATSSSPTCRDGRRSLGCSGGSSEKEPPPRQEPERRQGCFVRLLALGRGWLAREPGRRGRVERGGLDRRRRRWSRNHRCSAGPH